jgi:sugar phosphate isomerase/epimerase
MLNLIILKTGDPMKLSVFTVCMPEFTPEECVEYIASIGGDAVEWRCNYDEGDKSHPGYWSGNRTTISPEEMIKKGEYFKKICSDAGISMPSVGTYACSNDLEKVRIYMEAAAAVGAKNMRVSPPGYDKTKPYKEQFDQCREDYAKVAEYAKEFGVRANVETHMGQLGPTVFKARALIEGLSPEQVGIMYDPGNQIYEGYEVPAMALSIAGEYLGEVHAKNTRYEIDGSSTIQRIPWKPVACPLDSGIVQWPVVIEELKKINYTGVIALEDFSNELPTKEKVKGAFEYLRGLIA